MAIVKVGRTSDLAAVTGYVEYGRGDSAQLSDKSHRCISLSMTSAGGAKSSREWAREVTEQSLRSKGRNTVTGVTLIVSWSLDELDPNNPIDVARAQAFLEDFAQALAPYSPKHDGLQADGKSGCLHGHLTIGNIDYETDRPLDKQVFNWHYVRAVQDRLLREHGMRVIEREPISFTRAERLAQREGRQWQAYDDDLQLTEITSDTRADHTRVRVDAAIARAKSQHEAPTLEDFFHAAAQENLSVQYRTASKEGAKDALTYCLLDEQGEEIFVPIMSKRRKPSKTKAAVRGSALGTDFTLEGVMRQLQGGRTSPKEVTPEPEQMSAPNSGADTAAAARAAHMAGVMSQQNLLDESAQAIWDELQAIDKSMKEVIENGPAISTKQAGIVIDHEDVYGGAEQLRGDRLQQRTGAETTDISAHLSRLDDEESEYAGTYAARGSGEDTGTIEHDAGEFDDLYDLGSEDDFEHSISATDEPGHTVDSHGKDGRDGAAERNLEQGARPDRSYGRENSHRDGLDSSDDVRADGGATCRGSGEAREGNRAPAAPLAGEAVEHGADVRGADNTAPDTGSDGRRDDQSSARVGRRDAEDSARDDSAQRPAASRQAEGDERSEHTQAYLEGRRKRDEERRRKAARRRAAERESEYY